MCTIGRCQFTRQVAVFKGLLLAIPVPVLVLVLVHVRCRHFAQKEKGRGVAPAAHGL